MIIQKYMKEQVRKVYIYTRIGEWAEWSTFDWLCLLYKVKRGLITAIKVIEVFLVTSDVKDAEQLIKEMDLDVFKKNAI